MNILKFSRTTPYLIMLLTLFISCNSTEIEHTEETSQQTFDHSLYNKFIKNPENIEFLNKIKAEPKSELNLGILKLINQNNDINLSFPDEVIDITNISSVELLNYVIEKNIITEKHLNLLLEFENKIQTSGFDLAVENYQKNVIYLKLTNDEFLKHNLFINNMKLLNYYNPQLFSSLKTDSNIAQRVDWGCARASILLGASAISMTSCATGIGCGIGITLFSLSLTSHMDTCGW